MDETGGVKPVTLDDLTEDDIKDLLGRTLDHAEGEIVSEQALLRCQVEFWQYGRNNIIPMQWQARARKVIAIRDSRATKGDPK